MRRGLVRVAHRLAARSLVRADLEEDEGSQDESSAREQDCLQSSGARAASDERVGERLLWRQTAPRRHRQVGLDPALPMSGSSLRGRALAGSSVRVERRSAPHHAHPCCAPPHQVGEPEGHAGQAATAMVAMRRHWRPLDGLEPRMVGHPRFLLPHRRALARGSEEDGRCPSPVCNSRWVDAAGQP